MHDGNGEGLRLALQQGDLRAMLSATPTREEEVLADQYARNAGLVVECSRHSGQFYRCYPPLETIERMNGRLHLNHDRLLALIERSELQKKALILIVLANYRDECPQCKSA